MLGNTVAKSFGLRDKRRFRPGRGGDGDASKRGDGVGPRPDPIHPSHRRRPSRHLPPLPLLLLLPPPPTTKFLRLCPLLPRLLRRCPLLLPRLLRRRLHPHASSGERVLLSLRLRVLNSCPTSDLRAALRLLFSLDTLGLLTPPRQSESSRRIGGLLAGDLENVLEEGGEIAERIREGGSLISRARNRKRARDERRDGAVAVEEEEALLAVLTNAVEVQVGERGAIGIAVYGPAFSWFNHSCAPNACYRFELADRYEGTGSWKPDAFRVSPAGIGDASALVIISFLSNLES